MRGGVRETGGCEGEESERQEGVRGRGQRDRRAGGEGVRETGGT